MEDSMKEAEIEEQFRLLQQGVVLAGDAVEALRRDNRAEIDALKLEVQVLQRCLRLISPELQEHFDTVRAEVIRIVDPEAT
jgi:hypothetical protein